MANVTGPLMSMSASGKFGGTMVFATNKGRNVVRQLVTPSNPRTAPQVTVRNALAVAAAVQHVINFTTFKHAGLTSRDEVLLRGVAPSGETWNATVTREIVGTGSAKYAAATAAFALVVANDWNTAALALQKPYAPLSRPNPSGFGFVSVSAGEQFFRHQYALFTAGITPAAPTTPPVYAA